MAPPIRVGIIGLSAVQDFSGAGSWTAGAHLPALRSLPDQYEIVALANSSVESARRSAEFHKLPSTVRTYGSPEDLARDDGVDLVLVSVQVGKHYALARPALDHGKKVFVEWPLGASYREVEELTQLAATRDGSVGGGAVVGVQGRANPALEKIKSIIAGGTIGDVASSTLSVGSALMSAKTISEGWAYYVDKDSGGNFLTINFGHAVDAFVQVLGDIPKPQAIFKTHTQTVKVVNDAGEVVDPALRQTAPDHIFVQGVTDKGVLSSLTFRSVKSASSEGAGLRWVIEGTEGELVVTGLEMGLSMQSDLSVRLSVGDEPARDVSLDDVRPARHQDLPPPAQNVAAMWEAFAAGDTTKYATFESAASSHRLLERVRASAESS